MSALTHTYEVPDDDFTQAGEASGAIKRTLKDLGFKPEIVRKVAIATYEAEINMVIHAHGGTVTATIEPERVTVEFCDRGPGIPDISLAMQEGWSTATDRVRELGFGAGMGLPNIQKYTDEMSLESEVGIGTTLKITVYA